jgi:hypothetical protein
MAIKITRWTPDTCPGQGCVVDYAWDDSLANPSYSISAVLQRCILHQSLATGPHFTALLDENPRKNKLLSLLVAQFPAQVNTDANGSFLSFKIPIHRLFDANRVLILAIPSLTAAQVTALQALCDTNLGVGNVSVISGTLLQLLSQLITRFPALIEQDGASNLVNFSALISWTVVAGVINLSMPTLTQNQKTSLQSWCDTNLGAGKVLVV